MIDNQIIDIFYNQIAKEAKTGRVDCFFMTNIAFDLTVNNQTKELCDELSKEDEELTIFKPFCIKGAISCNSKRSAKISSSLRQEPSEISRRIIGFCVLPQ